MMNHPMRNKRIFQVWIVSILALLLMLACTPDSSQKEGGLHSGSDNQSFNFVRGKKVLLRLDSFDGRVWMTSESGDGGWNPLGDAPDPSGQRGVNGRYGLFSLVDRLNIEPDRLLRVDRATGRSWLRKTHEDNAWREIESASGEASPQEELVIETESSEIGSFTPEPTNQALPIISREKLENSDSDEGEKLEVVIQALQKTELAIPIRVWAARQLAVFEPALAVPPLLVALQYEQPEIVVAAIESLKTLGDPTTIPRILALKSHANPQVQEAVIAAVTVDR